MYSASRTNTQRTLEDAGLLRAYSWMLQHNLHDIPVVSREGKLVGVASRVDVGVAILSAWEKVE